MIVKEIIASDGRRKVEVFRRADGTYGFEALRFSDHPNEQCWISDGRYSECVAEDQQTAEAEARARVGWLQKVQGDS